MKLLAEEGRSYIFTQIHLSCVFLLVFIAYKSLENIQSSLNFEDGLGTISISLLYASYFLSSLLIGAPVVYLIKPKWSIFIALFSHTLFIVANIWPMWVTMAPASIILGLAAGPYWIGQGTYLTVLSSRYSKATGEDLSLVTAKFSGIFHAIWGASSSLGNFMSSFVLSYHHPTMDQNNCPSNATELVRYNYNNISHGNTSISSNCSEYETVPKNLDVCGPNHCPYMEEHTSVLQKPSSSLIYMLMGIFLGFNLLGICLALFLKSIPPTEQSSIKERVKSTFFLIKDPNLLLLIIPICFVGIIPGTFYGSFTQVCVPN